MSIKWEITESTLEGITLWVWNSDEKLIYTHRYYVAGSRRRLMADLVALMSGVDPSEWEGNNLTDGEIISNIRGSPNDTSLITIARSTKDGCTLYFKNMGMLGRLVLFGKGGLK